MSTAKPSAVRPAGQRGARAAPRRRPRRPSRGPSLAVPRAARAGRPSRRSGRPRRHDAHWAHVPVPAAAAEPRARLGRPRRRRRRGRRLRRRCSPARRPPTTPGLPPRSARSCSPPAAQRRPYGAVRHRRRDRAARAAELPGADISAALSLAALLTGRHTMRVWLDGPSTGSGSRCSASSPSPTWCATAATSGPTPATSHAVDALRPAGRRPGDGAAPAAARERVPGDLTPPGAGRQACSPRSTRPPSSRVDRTDPGRRACRRTPWCSRRATPAPRCGRVEIAVDAETSPPLRVQVFGAATEPAFETGFTDVSFADAGRLGLRVHPAGRRGRDRRQSPPPRRLPAATAAAPGSGRAAQAGRAAPAGTVGAGSRLDARSSRCPASPARPEHAAVAGLASSTG